MPDYKISIVGSHFSELDAQWNLPFSGPAGDELTRMLEDAGLERKACHLTNVFNLYPPGNDLAAFCVPKADRSRVPGLYPLIRGKYLKQDYWSEVTRLYAELAEVRPNLIIALGNTPIWALLGTLGVGKLRGAITHSTSIPGYKVLPTYDPGAILRQYDLRHVTVIDFMKAKIEAEYPEVRRPRREIWLDPTLEDLKTFYEKYVLASKRMAFDIETASNQITCIGFAPSVDRALVIPFVDQRKTSGSYWASLDEECKAWNWVQKILGSQCEKVGQNTLYDIFYLWYFYGITVENYSDDTMILHHSLQPESPKGLDFLGSVYCNEPAWKTARAKGKQTIKRED